MKRGLSDTISVEFDLLGSKTYSKIRSLYKLANIYHPVDKYFLDDCVDNNILPLGKYRRKNKSCFTRLNDKIRFVNFSQPGLYSVTRVVLYYDKNIFKEHKFGVNSLYGIFPHPITMERWSEVFAPGYIDIFLESDLFIKSKSLKYNVIPQIEFGKLSTKQINYLEKRKIDILKRKE